MGDGVSMFDPRVKAHSREQGMIMMAFRFPRDVEKEVDELFDKSAEQMLLRDAYYYGDEIIEMMQQQGEQSAAEDDYFPFDDDTLW